MSAGLVAELPQVELENRDAGGAQGKHSGLSESKLERWRDGGAVEDAELFD
jgi:hypothetical protein